MAQGTPATPFVSPYVATAVGRVDSAEESRALVAATDGVIERVRVNRGDAVVADQALLDVNCDERRAMTIVRTAEVRRSAASATLVEEGPRPELLAEARAVLASADATLLDRNQRLDQVLQLVERGFVSRREVEARTAERDRVDADKMAATARYTALVNGARPAERVEAAASRQARTAEAQASVAAADQCTMRSPINGHVLQILRHAGEFSGATQGSPLIIVGDLTRQIIRAEIGERDAGKIVSGTIAEIWVDGQAKRWRGKVVELASVMGRRTARSLDPTDRFDRDVREAIIEVNGTTPPALVGLRVTVGFVK